MKHVKEYMEYRDFLAATVFILQITPFSGAAIAPPLDFTDIIYVVNGVYGNADPGGQHQCTRYYGITQQFGGGLYILKNFRTDTAKVIDVVQNSTVQNGRLAGKKLSGGAFLSCDLSYDGKTILFAYAEQCTQRWNFGADNTALWIPQNCFHIFKVNVDGSNLVQLTDGNRNDFDPCWLPNGRIVFVSERTMGRSKTNALFFSRCFMQWVPQFTLHSMKSDGTDIIQLSYHETDEYQPSVNNDGMLVYTRWDYVDRDAGIAQHMWTCYPDGRDPRSYHGNYPLPLSTMTGTSFADGKYNAARPFAEWHIRAIPGSNKYVATAGPHHGEPYGVLITIDPNIPDDGISSQVKKITPGLQYPETNGGAMLYGTAWPLSDAFFLCNYQQQLCIVDTLGNREVFPIFSSGSGHLLTPPSTGLLHYWALNETAGTIAKDSSGTSDGTFVGAPLWSTGRSGNALKFNGTSDALTLPVFSLSGDFTIWAWVYLTGTVSNADVVLGSSTSNVNFYNGQVRLYGGSDIVTAQSAIATGTWTNIAITRSGSTVKLYFNGNLEAAGTWSGAFTVDHIGNGLGGYLEGMLDEIRIYNTAIPVSSQTAGLVIAPPMRPIHPIPLKARTTPPIIPTQTCQGENLLPNSPNATISILNVYESDMPLPAGTKVKELRIMQYFPKTVFPLDNPDVGYAGQSLCRMALGTVPVETDGSVYFKAPVGKALSFQLLDSNGMAVQLERSITYVHSGEQMSCVGCHENKWKAIPPITNPMALRRAPSAITPEAGGLEPINFHRLVKPVFLAKCAPCHIKEGKGPDMTYASLKSYAFWSSGSNRDNGFPFYNSLNLPLRGGSRSTPGKSGALGSQLLNHLYPTHNNVALTKTELRRITLWLDCNSNELGVYENIAAQRNGTLVWPSFDFDSTNKLGVETRVQTKIVSRGAVSGRTSLQFDVKARGRGLTVSFQSRGDYCIRVMNLAGKSLAEARSDGSTPVFISKRFIGTGVVIVNVRRRGSSEAFHQRFLIR